MDKIDPTPNTANPVPSPRKKLIIPGLAIIAAIVIMLLAFVFAVSRLSERKDPMPHSPTGSPQLPLKGVSLTPATYDVKGFQDFLAVSSDTGDILTSAGDWGDLGRSSSGHAFVMKQNGYTPVIMLTTHTTGEDLGNLRAIRTMDNQQIDEYTSQARKFAEKNEPPYLGLGIEINRLAAKLPADYQRFVELYQKTQAAVKKASPRTEVFVVFQLENMKGLNGGLFGEVNDPDSNQWHLLQDFTSADFVAFTTYPYLIYRDPGELPNDYYEEIARYTDKPIAFTEIGWPSRQVAPGWPSSEQSQVDFIHKFQSLTSDLDVNMVVWPFVFDPDVPAPFSDVGLITRDGRQKPALTTWQEYSP